MKKDDLNFWQELTIKDDQEPKGVEEDFVEETEEAPGDDCLIPVNALVEHIVSVPFYCDMNLLP